MGKLADYVDILDFKRIPVSEKERATRKKIYPYYGAQGIVDYIDGFIFDGEYILVAEDGENLRSLNQNIATWATGKFWVNNHAHILGNNGKASLRYIYYWISSMDLRRYVTGSAQPKFNQYNLANLKIDLPPLETQKQIAAVLSALDDKISLNKKINSSLEEMAKTIYLHNFFRKPTNAKISDILIENANSTISVGDAKESCGDFPFFTSGENILRWDEKIVDGRNIFLNDGGNVGVNFYVGAAAYSTHTWSVTAKNNAEDYLYLLLDSIQIEIEKRFFTGTGLKNLRKDLLRGHKIYIPSANELDAFNRIVQPCFNKISENLRENYQLAKVRDWLLPLLMNGQIKA